MNSISVSDQSLNLMFACLAMRENTASWASTKSENFSLLRYRKSAMQRAVRRATRQLNRRRYDFTRPRLGS